MAPHIIALDHTAIRIKQHPTSQRIQDKADDHAVLAIRNLVYDVTMQNGGGHGGSAVGMAAIGVALWKYIMRYNPSDPEWFDRDRFVLSNGMEVTSSQV